MIQPFRWTPQIVTQEPTADDVACIEIQAIEASFARLTKAGRLPQNRLDEVMDLANRLADWTEKQERAYDRWYAGMMR